MMYRSTLVPSVLAIVLLVGCGDEDGAAASPSADAASGTSVEPAAPTTQEVADPTDDGTGVTPSAGTEDRTVWPPEVSPVHGGQAWAVYLAVGSPDSGWEVLGETQLYARDLGYVGSGIGSVGCDQGAAEALGFDPGDNRVAVYFDSAARAQEFVAAYDRPDLGSAQVTTYCLD